MLEEGGRVREKEEASHVFFLEGGSGPDAEREDPLDLLKLNFISNSTKALKKKGPEYLMAKQS